VLGKGLFFIPLWKRSFITRICFEGLKRLYRQGFEGYVVCAVSRKEDAELCEEYGFDYTQVENFPLGRKMNLGIEYCLLNYEFDFLINMGSDNLLSPEVMDMWAEGINGTSINTITDGCQVKEVEFNNMLGAGRMVPSRYLKFWKKLVRMNESVMGGGAFHEGETYWVASEKADELNSNGSAEILSDEKFVWYENDINKALDDQSRQALVNEHRLGLVEGKKRVLFEIKSETNIWAFDELEGKPATLPSWISTKEKQMIDEIGKA